MVRLCTLELTVRFSEPPLVLVRATKCIGEAPHVEIPGPATGSAEGARMLARALNRAADWLEEED
jgi:hypothetical protein